MNSISVSPFLPTPAMTGTQDNGTLVLLRLPDLVPAAHRRRRRLRLRRDRAEHPLPHVHRRADGHQLRRRQSDVVAVDRRRLHRRDRRGPALLRAGDLRPDRVAHDLRRCPARLAHSESRRRPLRSSSSTATRPPTSSARATCSTPVRAAPATTGRRSAPSPDGRGSRHEERRHPDVASRADATAARCGSQPQGGRVFVSQNANAADRQASRSRGSTRRRSRTASRRRCSSTRRTRTTRS